MYYCTALGLFRLTLLRSWVEEWWENDLNNDIITKMLPFYRGGVHEGQVRG
jgi:hypothetical protein